MYCRNRPSLFWSQRHLPESWRSRPAGVVIQSESKGLKWRLRVEIPNWIWKPKNQSVQGQRQKMNLSAQAERTKSLLYLFVLLKISVGLAKLTAWVRMICGTQFTDSNANLFSDTPWNDVLPTLWSSLSPVLLTHTSNHHKAHSCLPKSYGG